jgi:hypothetical protein
MESQSNLSPILSRAARPVPATVRPPAQHQLIDLRASLDLPALRRAFDEIPSDPYFDKANGERCKSIARFRVWDERVERQPHGPLYQSQRHNPVHGGIVRHYEELPADVAASPSIRAILTTFARRAGLDGRQEILLQLQRIRCLGDRALPAVEGWHQDGTQMLGILVISRTNVTGGVSMLSLDRGRDVTFERVLRAGEMVLFDDERLWHYATPVEPVDPSAPSHRDIVILTHPSCREG